MGASGLGHDLAHLALEKNGYFVFKATQPIQAQLTEIYEVARSFFESSLESKILEELPLDAGYRSFGGEYSQTPDRPDQVESFSVSPMVSDAISRLHSATARSLYLKMLAIFSHFEAIAENFIIDAAKFVDGGDRSAEFSGALHLWSYMQLSWLDGKKSSVEYPIDPHEDGCIITIMSNTAPGLEIQSAADGNYTALDVREDELILIAGGILSLLSGGVYRPTHHRVKSALRLPPRMSLLFFADLEPHLCKPWVSNEINNGVDIAELVRNSATRFGLKVRTG